MTLEELWELFPILLTEHNPAWKDWYRQERELLSVLLPFPVRFHHVGSTALPHIYAKPIVDVLAEVSTEAILAQAIGILKENGYLLMNASPTRALPPVLLAVRSSSPLRTPRPGTTPVRRSFWSVWRPLPRTSPV